MIKINLLPFRLARKKENIRRQISIFFLLIALAGIALFWYTIGINKKIVDAKEKVEEVDRQIKKYKAKANRVTQIEKNLKLLKEKLEVVSLLEEGREKQLILFDGMTDLVVPGRMWLESLKTNENSVAIKGIAFDNQTVADFMERLENSPLFGRVDLKTSQIKKLKNNTMLKSFELLCIKEKPKPVKKEASKQGRK
jgi:type IV pilus assembly protein PilN